jgi:ubiquitin carboxyl-terminal hydrolase 4/11
VPLGGPHFREILAKFPEESSDAELPDSGEGRRLDEGSSLTGSSSALQGAGATHLPGSPGGNTHNQGFVLSRTSDAVPLLSGSPDSQGVHQSIEEDEGIDMTEDSGRPKNPMAGNNSWNFDNMIQPLQDPADLGSREASDAASDVAQYSGDERTLSTNDLDFGVGHNASGLRQYTLPARSEDELPSYGEAQSQYAGNAAPPNPGQFQPVHEVVPVTGEDEQHSEVVTEIHLDNSDKIKYT